MCLQSMVYSKAHGTRSLKTYFGPTMRFYKGKSLESMPQFSHVSNEGVGLKLICPQNFLCRGRAKGIGDVYLRKGICNVKYERVIVWQTSWLRSLSVARLRRKFCTGWSGHHPHLKDF